MTDEQLLAQFLDGTLDPSTLSHEVHVQLAYLLLETRALPETLIALRDGIQRIAARAGHPEKYHETITFAFATIVNERKSVKSASWEEFRAANEDLMEWRSGAVLDRWYSPGLLTDPTARATFVLSRR